MIEQKIRKNGSAIIAKYGVKTYLLLWRLLCIGTESAINHAKDAIELGVDNNITRYLAGANEEVDNIVLLENLFEDVISTEITLEEVENVDVSE